MIVEEEKAHKKMCPYEQGSEQAFNCQGSKCMAWRWAPVDVVRYADDKFAPAAEWIERIPSTTHGYCGLAGRP